jgi:hypothetical protein
MKREDIIKMAKEYADEVTNGHGIVTYEFDAYGLEKFALLIGAAERERIIAANAPEIEKVNVYIKALEDAVAAEREACAKVCDEQEQRSRESSEKSKRERDQFMYHHCAVTAKWNAAAIRARREQ